MAGRTVTIYALEHDGRAYVGSALDPMVRLRKHVEGTGAKCTRRWIQYIESALPDFWELGTYPEGDRVPAERAWIGEYARQGWDIVNVILNVWPIDTEALARGGRQTVHKMHETNKANGWEQQRRNLRKANEINQANGWEQQRQVGHKLVEINKANGWEHQRRSARKMNEINKANGWEGSRRGGRISSHVRNHVNRGVVNLECSLCQKEGNSK